MVHGLILVWLVFTGVACSGSDSGTKTPPSATTIEAGARGGEVAECPQSRDIANDSPRELALALACNAADFDHRSMTNLRVAELSNDGSRAEWRVLGDEAKCQLGGCPREVEYEVTLFQDSRGRWEAEYSQGWTETLESRKQHAEAMLRSVEFSVDGSVASWQSGNIEVPGQLGPKGQIIVVWMLVEFQDGSHTVMWSADGTSFSWMSDMILPEDRSKDTLPATFDSAEHLGETLRLSAYRYGIPYDGVEEIGRGTVDGAAFALSEWQQSP